MFKKIVVAVSALVVAATSAGSAVGAARDRDHDKLPDRWERRHHLSTKKPSARKDPDRDGLSNRREYRLRTNPRRRDTDRDGLNDGAEVRRWHTNPRRADTDRDGFKDGLEVRKGSDPLDRRSVPGSGSGGSIAVPNGPSALPSPGPSATASPTPTPSPSPSPTPTPPPGTQLEAVDGGLDWYGQFSNPMPTDPAFFPIGVWFESVESAGDLAKDKMAGLNTYVELTATSDMALVRSWGMHAMHSGEPSGSGSETKGWLTVDEPDMWAGPGHDVWTGNFPGQGDICDPVDPARCGYTVLETLNQRLPDDGRMRYTNYGKGVAFWYSDEQASEFLDARYQDLVSTDTYWFTDNNICGSSEGGGVAEVVKTNDCHVAANYGWIVQRQRELMEKARPVWGFVELAHPFSEDDWPSITPAQVHAAVWHSLIAGARGMVYFNHSFGGPYETQHALRDPAYADIRDQVTTTNGQIAALAPVLNSPTVTTGWSQGAGTRAMVKWSGGKLYLFAGSGGSATTGSFSLPCTGDATATVLDESRTRPITNGSFTDAFADGNAVHIYRIDGCGSQG